MADEKKDANEAAKPAGVPLKEVLHKVNKAAQEMTGGWVGGKSMLLDASEQQATDPEHRYRYINVKQADNALRRKAQGYEIVPEGQGGHRLGDEMALARTPIANYKKRVDDGDKLGKQRLEAHKSEVQQAVLSVVRELRDNHGISVDEKRLFVNE